MPSRGDRLGVGMVVLALRVYRIRDGAEANRAAMQLFGFSILYLFVLFALADRRAGLRRRSRAGVCEGMAMHAPFERR